MKIYIYPDPILRAHAEPVAEITEEIRDLIQGMIETMYQAPGIGLAANQVGVARRAIVFEKVPGEEKRNAEALINPEIIESDGQITSEEACLSVLDYAADVTRASYVKVKGLDLEGNPVEMEAEDLKAICLQHEIDHLNGILFIDHISGLKRSLYKKKLKKILKKRDKSN
ncbi:MAG: peptide deformylase [Deltaproteobacteria bacterium]|nr:MAG: peptide deformylase [Deltaproteobacteria bacterium]